MAVERTFKAFLQHKTNGFDYTHNLSTLLDKAARLGLMLDPKLLDHFPPAEDVIHFRYGLGDGIIDAFDTYKAALSIASETIKQFSRKITFAGAGVLLKKPPWITLPEFSIKDEQP
jgi:hypothetical protein